MKIEWTTILAGALVVLDEPAFDPVIDEMIARFLEIDLVSIKAPTLATPTGHGSPLATVRR